VRQLQDAEQDWDQAAVWEQQGQAADLDVTGEIVMDPPERAERSGRRRRVVGRSLTAVAAIAVVTALAVNLAVRDPEPPPSAQGASSDAAVPSPDAPVTEVTPGDLAGTVPSEPDAEPTLLPDDTQPSEAPPARDVPTSRAQPTRGAASQPTIRPAAPAPPVPRLTDPRAGVVVRIVNAGTGKSVAVSGGSASDGAGIVESGEAAGTAQHWRLVAAPNGCFSLVNARSGKALDNPDGSSVDGRQMQQWTVFAGNTNQVWCFRGVGGNGYSVRNVTSGSLLDVRDGRSVDGTPIQQWSADPASPNANQTWRLHLV